MMRIAVRGLISLLAGLVIAFLLAVVTTPWLWKLERVMGVELAGHSGPSAWVILVYLLTSSTLIFLVLRWAESRKTPNQGQRKKVETNH